MHPYYLKHKKRYAKEIEKLLSFGKTEVEELFEEDFPVIVKQVKNTFESEILSKIPYVGGSQNVNDTNNLVGCCEYAALFWVGRAYNLSDEQVGELLTKLEERHFKPLSPIVQKGIRKLLKRRFVQKLLKKIAVNSQKFSEEYVMTKDAIIACDFSGDVLEGVDRGEEFQRDAYTLRSMRTDFALFNRQLGILSGNELRIFKGYLSGEKDIGDIAEEEGIQYESAAQKVRRAKVKIKVQMIGFLEGIA